MDLRDDESHCAAGEPTADLVSEPSCQQSSELSLMHPTRHLYSAQAYGIFHGDLDFYFGGWDGRSRMKDIDTKKCPVYMLTGEYVRIRHDPSVPVNYERIVRQRLTCTGLVMPAKPVASDRRQDQGRQDDGNEGSWSLPSHRKSESVRWLCARCY